MFGAGQPLDQTTLGKTISSEDSSRASGAWLAASTSPQQLLLPPLGDLGLATPEDEPTDGGRDVFDHRTTELGSMLIDSVRSDSAFEFNRKIVVFQFQLCEK